MPTAPEALPRYELERKLRRSRTLNLAFGALAVVGLVFGGVQWFGNESAPNLTSEENGPGGAAADDGPANSSGDSGAAATVSLERRIDGDPMAIGAIDAPIVVSEWIDFRCPFCAVFSRDTFPQIVQEYVDSGKVRIEVHDVAYFGEESERAATAARAAGEQGKYFEFVEAVYKVAPERGHPDLPVEELIGFAKQVGVPDLARFEHDLQSTELLNAVRESTATAQQLGVNGVPFFAVGGQALSGAQPIESFRQFIDGQLTAG